MYAQCTWRGWRWNNPPWVWMKYEAQCFSKGSSSSGWSALFVLLSLLAGGQSLSSFDGIIRDCLCQASRDIPNVPSVPEPPSYIVIHCHTPTTALSYYTSQYTAAVAMHTILHSQSFLALERQFVILSLCSRKTFTIPFKEYLLKTGKAGTLISWKQGR